MGHYLMCIILCGDFFEGGAVWGDWSNSNDNNNDNNDNTNNDDSNSNSNSV